MMERRTVLSLAVASLAGCSSRAGREVERRVRVSVYPSLSACPFHLALEQGYFRKAGFRVVVEQLGDPTRFLPLLARGQLDVSFGALSPALINAVLKGARIRIVAGRQRAVAGCNDGAVLYADRRAFPGGLKDLRQLKGKRVGVTGRTNVTGFALDVILSRVGLSAADIELKSLSHPEAAAAFLGGKLDAIAATYLDRDLEGLSPNVIRSIGLADVLPNHQYAYVVYGVSMLDADPDAGARFLGAYLRGVREFVAGKTPRFLEEYAKSNRLDPQRSREACRAYQSIDGEIDVNSMQLCIDWCVRNGYCPVPAAPEALIDRRFLEGAREWARQVEAG